MLIERKLYPECHEAIEAWMVSTSHRNDDVKELAEAERLIGKIIHNFMETAEIADELQSNIIHNIRSIRKIKFLSKIKFIPFVQRIIDKTESNMKTISLKKISTIKKTLNFYIRQIKTTDNLFGYLKDIDWPRLKKYAEIKKNSNMSIKEYSKTFNTRCEKYENILNSFTS